MMIIKRLQDWQDWSEDQNETALTNLLESASDEIIKLRKILSQVLVDAKSQEVLSEWWTVMENALGDEQ